MYANKCVLRFASMFERLCRRQRKLREKLNVYVYNILSSLNEDFLF